LARRHEAILDLIMPIWDDNEQSLHAKGAGTTVVEAL
jgi:hypothetical protein